MSAQSTNGVPPYARAAYGDNTSLTVGGNPEDRLVRIFGQQNQVHVDSLDKVPKTKNYLGKEAWMGEQEYLSPVLMYHFEQMNGWEPVLANFVRRSAKIHKYLIYQADLHMMQPANVGHAPEYITFKVQQQQKKMRRVALGFKMDYERVMDGPSGDVRDEWLLKNGILHSAAIVSAKLLIEDAVSSALDFWYKYDKESGPRYGSLKQAISREIRNFGIFNKQSQSAYIITNEARQTTRTSGIVPTHGVVGFGDQHFLAYASKDDRTESQVGVGLGNQTLIKGGESLQYRYNNINLMEATRRHLDEADEPLEFLQNRRQIGRCALIDWTLHKNVPAAQWNSHLQSVQWLNGVTDDWETISVKKAIDASHRFDSDGNLRVDALGKLATRLGKLLAESGLRPDDRRYVDPYLREVGGAYQVVDTWGEQDEHYNSAENIIAWAKIASAKITNVASISGGAGAVPAVAAYDPSDELVAAAAALYALSPAAARSILAATPSDLRDIADAIDTTSVAEIAGADDQAAVNAIRAAFNLVADNSSRSKAAVIVTQLEAVSGDIPNALSAQAIADLVADYDFDASTLTDHVQGRLNKIEAILGARHPDLAYVRALFAAPINGAVMKRWADAGVPVPTNYLLINPHIVIRTGGMFFFQQGAGELAFNFQHNTVGFSSTRRELLTHATSYMSAVVTDPRRLITYRDTFWKELMGGMGSKWWTDPAAYIENPFNGDGFVADVGGNYTADDFKPVMALTKIDVSDFRVNLDVPDKELSILSYPSQLYYAGLFGFHKINQNTTHNYSTNRHYNNRVNMTFLPCAYREAVPHVHGGGYARPRTGKTHLGPYEFPGLVEYINGKLGVVELDRRARH